MSMFDVIRYPLFVDMPNEHWDALPKDLIEYWEVLPTRNSEEAEIQEIRELLLDYETPTCCINKLYSRYHALSAKQDAERAKEREKELDVYLR